jgi:glycerol-3-phosphate dehydrogenase
LWQLTLADGRSITARRLINAAGPWAEDIARRVMGLNDAPPLRPQPRSIMEWSGPG